METKKGLEGLLSGNQHEEKDSPMVVAGDAIGKIIRIIEKVDPEYHEAIFESINALRKAGSRKWGVISSIDEEVAEIEKSRATREATGKKWYR